MVFKKLESNRYKSVVDKLKAERFKIKLLSERAKTFIEITNNFLRN